jgi:predicted nuclease of predicted toxin-antitoxin system
VIKLASDENFDADIVRGLLRRVPDLDIESVQDANLSGSSDPTILAWAARENRVLLTHDRLQFQAGSRRRLCLGTDHYLW